MTTPEPNKETITIDRELLTRLLRELRVIREEQSEASRKIARICGELTDFATKTGKTI